MQQQQIDSQTNQNGFQNATKDQALIVNRQAPKPHSEIQLKPVQQSQQYINSQTADVNIGGFNDEAQAKLAQQNASKEATSQDNGYISDDIYNKIQEQRNSFKDPLLDQSNQQNQDLAKSVPYRYMGKKTNSVKYQSRKHKGIGKNQQRNPKQQKKPFVKKMNKNINILVESINETKGEHFKTANFLQLFAGFLKSKQIWNYFDEQNKTFFQDCFSKEKLSLKSLTVSLLDAGLVEILNKYVKLKQFTQYIDANTKKQSLKCDLKKCAQVIFYAFVGTKNGICYGTTYLQKNKTINGTLTKIFYHAYLYKKSYGVEINLETQVTDGVKKMFDFLDKKTEYNQRRQMESYIKVELYKLKTKIIKRQPQNQNKVKRLKYLQIDNFFKQQKYNSLQIRKQLEDNQKQSGSQWVIQNNRIKETYKKIFKTYMQSFTNYEKDKKLNHIFHQMNKQYQQQHKSDKTKQQEINTSAYLYSDSYEGFVKDINMEDMEVKFFEEEEDLRVDVSEDKIQEENIQEEKIQKKTFFVKDFFGEKFQEQKSFRKISMEEQSLEEEFIKVQQTDTSTFQNKFSLLFKLFTMFSYSENCQHFFIKRQLQSIIFQELEIYITYKVTENKSIELIDDENGVLLKEIIKQEISMNNCPRHTITSRQVDKSQESQTQFLYETEIKHMKWKYLYGKDYQYETFFKLSQKIEKQSFLNKNLNQNVSQTNPSRIFNGSIFQPVKLKLKDNITTTNN